MSDVQGPFLALRVSADTDGILQLPRVTPWRWAIPAAAPVPGRVVFVAVPFW